MGFSLYLGPYQPFLEEALAGTVRDFRSLDPLSPLVVLVPNDALVRHLAQDLARRNGSTFNLRVKTLRNYLDEFTEEKWVREGAQLLPGSLVPWVLRENARKGVPGKVFRGVEAMPGFHKTLRSTLSGLRQGGFTPEDLAESAKILAKAKGRRRLSDKLMEFSRLLAANRDWKREHGWKDLEDLHEDALTLPPPQDPVWTYGFYDASILQQKVLRHLCSGKPTHWFIPYEEHPAFEYAKPFVEWVKSLGKVERTERFKSGKGTALGRLQDHMFKVEGPDPPSPPHPSPPPQGERGNISPSPIKGEGRDEGGFAASDVKVLLCPGEPKEMREAVRALTEEAERGGTHFSQCGLLLRQLETYRRMVAPTFEEQGVPLAKRPPAFLMETSEAKAFLLLLECFQRDFPRETLMDLLSSPNLSAEGFGLGEEDWNPHLWDQVSKEAAVVEGKESWLDRLQAYEKVRADLGSRKGEGSPEEEARSLALFRTRVLQLLFDHGRRFEKEKRWADKAQVLFGLTRKIFLDSKAKKELETLRRGVGILSKDLTGLAGDDLEGLLSDLMEEVRIPWDAPEPGGVEVLDLMQARGVPFDVVILPGLVEQGFPRLARPDPLLLDEERRILNERHRGKARVPEKSEGRLEEKLLFLLAARSARKRLILTASHLHPGTGAPRIPSGYLYEALRAVTGERRAKWDGSPFVRKVAVSDWIREGGRADDLEEILGRFQEARDGDPLPAQAYAGEKPFFEEARRLLKERQGSREFTAYDGILRGAEALGKLRAEHSLKGTPLSASRLETYATCPLKYFYRYVLGLKIHPEPERNFQLDPAEKGTLMHSILEETLARGVKEGWLKGRAGEKAGKALEEETQKAFERLEKEGVPGSPALWEWSRFIVRKDLQRALGKVLADEDWTPVDFEVAFGRTDLQRGAAETQREVSFKTKEGQTFRLEGFMDRVDLSPDGKKLRVVDYKSGSKDGFKKDSVKEGTKIQMPLYLWACRVLYPDAVPEEAVYEFLTAKGGYGEVGFDARDWKKVEEPLRVLLTTAAEAVEEGLFPAAAKACKNCDYRLLCGPGAEKRGEKKRLDGKVGKYFELENLK